MKKPQVTTGTWFENEKRNWVYVGATQYIDDSFQIAFEGPKSEQTSLLTRMEATALRDALNKLI